MTKKNLVQKKQYDVTNLKQQLNSKKAILQQNTQRLTQLEGKIKILRNKSTTSIFADYAKISTDLNQRKNEQKQIKKRIEKV